MQPCPNLPLETDGVTNFLQELEDWLCEQWWVASSGDLLRSSQGMTFGPEGEASASILVLVSQSFSYCCTGHYVKTLSWGKLWVHDSEGLWAGQ